MGRTQPSFTASVDSEMEKLSRIANRVGLPCLRRAVTEASKRVRYFQNASYDEMMSPQELVMLALISAVAEGFCSDGGVRS